MALERYPSLLVPLRQQVRWLSAREIALERALRFLGKLRKTLGERLRRRSEEILETQPNPDVLTLVEVVSRSKD